MKIYRTKDAAEAVALATELKLNGTYDWFRGQISNWPLKSSFARLKPEAVDETMQKLTRFQHWVKMTPGLEQLADHADSIIAVAQHYGLPTNFIDFTTDPKVAGFFSSYGTPAEGLDSCIMCLNTSDLINFWKSMPTKYRPPECISLEVPNLWRLEAQAGIFLFCPYNNFEFIYDLDRIVFPHIGLIAEPRVEEMYPQRKSHLEILLDQYFMNEKLLEGTRALQKMAIYRNAHRIDDLPNKCDPDLIIDGNLPKESSWELTKLQAWLNPKYEKYSATITEEHWEFVIDKNENPNESGKDISSDVSRHLQNNPSIRSKLVTLIFRFSEDSAIACKQSDYLS